MNKKNMKLSSEEFWLLKLQIKTFLQLIMSDTMGNIYGKSHGQLSITQVIVKYLSMTDLLKVSYSCKRLYIVMGDFRVLQRF